MGHILLKNCHSAVKVSENIIIALIAKYMNVRIKTTSCGARANWIGKIVLAIFPQLSQSHGENENRGDQDGTLKTEIDDEIPF